MADLVQINAQTIAEVAAQSPTYAKEILWVGQIVLDSARYNPFADLMTGAAGASPIKEYLDTSKVRGTKIVITKSAGLGGKGVQGSTSLLGNEEKQKYAQFELDIGLHRHAVGFDRMTKDQTFIGMEFDRQARPMLADWLTRMKCDCIEACMIGEATSRNTLYANNRATVDKLGSADVLSRTTISSAKIMANGLGTKPLAIAKAKGNQRILKYYIQGNDYLFQGLRQNSTWESLLATAGNRGPDNYIFGGDLPEYDGVLLNNWAMESTSSDAAQGAFCAPRAYLGEAIAANNTAPTIKGGGYNGNSTLTTIAAAKTLNDYFRYFPNAPFAAFERTIISSGSDRRYLMIQNFSGSDVGKFGFYTYTTTDGFTITATERLRSAASGDAVTTLTGSSITWGTAPWETAYLTDAHPIGSLIVPVNAKGQPYCRGYLFGNDAITCGYGTIDGKSTGAMGQRIAESQDYGKNAGIGVALVWGVKADENAAKIVNGYVVIVAAYNLPGMPTITGG